MITVISYSGCKDRQFVWIIKELDVVKLVALIVVW